MNSLVPWLNHCNCVLKFLRALDSAQQLPWAEEEEQGAQMSAWLWWWDVWRLCSILLLTHSNCWMPQGSYHGNSFAIFESSNLDPLQWQFNLSPKSHRHWRGWSIPLIVPIQSRMSHQLLNRASVILLGWEKKRGGIWTFHNNVTNRWLVIIVRLRNDKVNLILEHGTIYLLGALFG